MQQEFNKIVFLLVLSKLSIPESDLHELIDLVLAETFQELGEDIIFSVEYYSVNHQIGHSDRV